jgi:hypothetical protein
MVVFCPNQSEKREIPAPLFSGAGTQKQNNSVPPADYFSLKLLTPSQLSGGGAAVYERHFSA